MRVTVIAVALACLVIAGSVLVSSGGSGDDRSGHAPAPTVPAPSATPQVRASSARWLVSRSPALTGIGFRSDFEATLLGQSALAAWNERSQTDVVSAALRSTTTRRLESLHGQLGGGPVSLGDHRVALVDISGSPDPENEDGVHQDLEVVTARSDTSVVRRERLASADGIWAGALASSPRGDLAVAWVECRRYPQCGQQEGQHLRVSVRPAAGTWTRPLTLTRTFTQSGDFVGLAFNAHGDLVVGYVIDDGVAIGVRVRAANGAFGPQQTLARDRRRGHEGPVRVAIAPNGRLAVASGTYTIRAAVRDAHASRFRQMHELEHNAKRGDETGGFITVVSDLHLALGQDGRTIVTWGEHRHLRMATAGPTGDLGDPQLVTGSYGAVHDVAVAHDGRTIIAWDDRVTGIQARIRDPDANTFATRQLIFAGPSVDGLRTTFDPATNRPTVLWPADDGLYIARPR